MTTEPFSIREATIEDCATLAWLNQLFNGGDGDVEQMRRQMEAARVVERPFLALFNQQPVGFACLRLIPMVCDPHPYAELTELFVLDAARRQGVGRALVAHVEAVARQAGAVRMGLMTGLDNLEAQAFYRTIGYSDDGLEMEKGLIC
ncbi:MAG: GNAT family N-acetyltransferase [Anaerolineales bacterium]|nr:GNAT family N-acetyltransferase [Anaerolineales bacterium]